MNVTIRKIGNSEGVIIPKEVLQRQHLKSGDTLALSDENGTLSMRRLDDPDEFERKMSIARERMKKYEKAYRVLAK